MESIEWNLYESNIVLLCYRSIMLYKCELLLTLNAPNPKCEHVNTSSINAIRGGSESVDGIPKIDAII